MNNYKFRAECSIDVARLILKTYEARHLIHITGWTSTPRHADVEVEVAANCSINILRQIMSMIPDGHVMIETIALTEKYTGERIAI